MDLISEATAGCSRVLCRPFKDTCRKSCMLSGRLHISLYTTKNAPYYNVLLASTVFILQNIILIWWKQWQHFDNRAFGCSFGVLTVIIWMHHKVPVNPSHNGERPLKCRHTVLAKYLLFAGWALSCHHCCCCGCWG